MVVILQLCAHVSTRSNYVNCAFHFGLHAIGWPGHTAVKTDAGFNPVSKKVLEKSGYVGTTAGTSWRTCLTDAFLGAVTQLYAVLGKSPPPSPHLLLPSGLCDGLCLLGRVGLFP